MILEWFPPKEFYELPVSVEKKSWRFPYFVKKLLSNKNRDIFVGHPIYIYTAIYYEKYLKNSGYKAKLQYQQPKEKQSIQKEKKT